MAGMAEPKKQQWVLTLSCPDTQGIVHGVANYLLITGCTIVDSQQYGDPDTGLFFMRVNFERGTTVTLDQLHGSFAAVGGDLPDGLADPRRRGADADHADGAASSGTA